MEFATWHGSTTSCDRALVEHGLGLLVAWFVILGIALLLRIYVSCRAIHCRMLCYNALFRLQHCASAPARVARRWRKRRQRAASLKRAAKEHRPPTCGACQDKHRMVLAKSNASSHPAEHFSCARCAVRTVATPVWICGKSDSSGNTWNLGYFICTKCHGIPLRMSLSPVELQRIDEPVTLTTLAGDTHRVTGWSAEAGSSAEPLHGFRALVAEQFPDLGPRWKLLLPGATDQVNTFTIGELLASERRNPGQAIVLLYPGLQTVRVSEV